jgi:hypothetical protein
VWVEPEGDLVHVVVRVPPLGGALPGLRVTAEAVAAREPAVAAPTGEADDTDPESSGPAGSPAPPLPVPVSPASPLPVPVPDEVPP